MTEKSLSPDQAPNEKSTKGKLKTLTQGKNAFLSNVMKCIYILQLNSMLNLYLLECLPHIGHVKIILILF